jgi:hypothetical protein
VVCRSLNDNRLTGPLPTELGTMDAVQNLCVRRPSPTAPGRVRCHTAMQKLRIVILRFGTARQKMVLE